MPVAGHRCVHAAGNCLIAFQDSRGKPGVHGHALLLAVELEYVETRVAVDDIDQSAFVDVDIVGLRRDFACRRFRDEVADFLRRRRIGDIDDAQASSEPRAIEQGVTALPVFLALVGAEASRRSTTPG